MHCGKSARIRRFSSPYFPAFGLNTERYSIFRDTPYSVRMRENTDQKNSEYGHFSSSVRNSKLVTLRLKISRLNSILCKNIINNISNKKNKVTRRNNQENKMTMHKINVFIPQRTDVTSITRAMLEPAS